MQITIKTLTGKVEQIQLGSTASVCELTQQVEECFGVPAEEQKLIFNGMRLENGLLSVYGLTKDSDVYMVVDIDGGKGKKKKKKTKKPKKPHRKRKVNLAILKYYKVDGGKVVRLRQRSPAGTFMAEHSDRYYCGKSHITYKKKEETTTTAPPKKEAPVKVEEKKEEKGGKGKKK
jgi:small subunit ribosomal protein S27Ae